VRTIEDTSTSTFARPISLADAVTGPLMPAGHSRLARVPASAATLPDETLDAAAQASSTLPLVRAMLNGKEDAQVGPLLAGYALAQQRIESAGWGRARSPGTGTEYARGIARQLV